MMSLLIRTAGGANLGSSPALNCSIKIIKPRKAMKRPIAILLIVLIIAGLIFSTYALSQGKFVEALIVYPLLVFAYIFMRLGKKE